MLLELGATVDAPFYHVSFSGALSGLQDTPTRSEISHETIADIVWRTDCKEAIDLVHKYTNVSAGRLTAHGILRAAGKSVEDLADLLRNSQTPNPLERLSIEGLALMKAIDEPGVLLNMIKAGFDLHEPRDFLYVDFGSDALEFVALHSFVPREVILRKYFALISEQPFHHLARQVLRFIPPKAWIMTPDTSAILGVCKTSDSLNLLFQTGLQLHKPFLISTIAQAARENDLRFVALLLGLLGDINHNLRTGPIHWNVLVLAAIAEPFVDRRSGLDLGGSPANIETLDWLFAHGASRISCIQTLDSIRDLGRSIVFDIQRLEWFLSHDIRPQGQSICGIVMGYVSLDSSRDISEITTSFFEFIKTTDIPLFDPCYTMIDQSGQSVIRDFALVYFIKLGAPLGFLQHLCDSGIDCNTPANHEASICKCLTPLQAAILRYRVDVVQYLLSKGADTNGGTFQNALQTACDMDLISETSIETQLSTKIAIVKCLLKNSAEPCRTGTLNAPALRSAVFQFCKNELESEGHRFREQHLQLLEVLLDASVGADGFDRILGDALRDASQCLQDGEPRETLIQLLRGYKTEIDQQIWSWDTCGWLMEACRTRDIDLIKTLLEQGANPNWYEPRIHEHGPHYPRSRLEDKPVPSTPSALLAGQGDIPLLLLLRAAGAELVRQDNSLECAAAAGKLDTVALLLQFEKRECEFARALMRAQIKNHVGIQRLIEDHLRSMDSDLLEYDNWKHPLYYPVEGRHVGRITGEDFTDFWARHDGRRSDYNEEFERGTKGLVKQSESIISSEL
ncbi:hypothetical protein E8E14_008358 [Neopestalotiopsis sp. 37M]|nr:hypothetical protein E8E14_008358 [Neopestalotiopsis sp. 37M]